MYKLTELFLYKFVFIAELLIAMHMYSFRMKKRNKYVLRVILGSLLCMALGYAYPVASFSAWYASLMFFVLFFFCSVSLFFIYDIPVKQVFFLAVASYTTQHFAHELYSLIATTTTLALDSTLGMYGDEMFSFDFSDIRAWFSVLVHIEVYFASYWALYKIFGKKINRDDMRISNFSIAVIAALILLVDIVMNAIAVYIPEGYNRTYTALSCVYNLICCILILYIQVKLCVQKKLESEVQTLSFLLHQSEEQYRQSNENIMLLNLKCHDLKHQIREYTQKHTLDEEYIKDLENIVNIYDSPVKTGNDALDLILTEKSLSCRKNRISLTCFADCSRLGFISNADLYGLFGNIVDNAMEAVMKIEDETKREMSINVRNINSFISIEAENYYDGEVKTDDSGMPVTTKKNKDYHGYGLKSVSLIVEKYGGDLRISADGNIFSLCILFPVSDK